MKPLTLTITSLFLAFGFAAHANAYAFPGMMMGGYGYETTAASSTTATTSADADQAAGAALMQKLQANEISCADLTETDFDHIGDYVMGGMMGSAHEYADQRMTEVLGASGEEAMHVAMGERFSGCNPNAAYPPEGAQFVTTAGFGGAETGGASSWSTFAEAFTLLAVLVGAIALLLRLK
ncbi:MAG: hypothetical protein KGI73_03210 [Patescibacteria group bacterium]|nr:hypothetical protein [Patescibacteria group bacterium]